MYCRGITHIIFTVKKRSTMATRFPIFRSLQRSIVGSIGVGVSLLHIHIKDNMNNISIIILCFFSILIARISRSLLTYDYSSRISSRNINQSQLCKLYIIAYLRGCTRYNLIPTLLCTDVLAYYDDFFFHTMYYYNMNWPTQQLL